MNQPSILSPTARLIIQTVRIAGVPLSIDMIAAETGTPASTVLNVTQELVRAGHLTRTKIRRYSFFTVPVVPQ